MCGSNKYGLNKDIRKSGVDEGHMKCDGSQGCTRDVSINILSCTYENLKGYQEF